MADYIVHKAVELTALSAKTRAALEAPQDWILSPKYDGCHAVFCYDNGKFIGAYSRSGESVKSMNHIAADLPCLYNLQEGRIAIAGEAWMLGTEFNVISGMFRRQYAQPDLGFVPFDVIPFDYNDDTASAPVVLLGQSDHRVYPAPYWQRMHALMQRSNLPSAVMLPRYEVLKGVGLTDAMAYATVIAKINKSRTDSFFDGAVLCQYSGLYSVGSGKGGEIIKVKPLLSETVTCNALFPAVGDKTGKNTLALGFELNGKAQKVSTGMTQEQIDSFIADNRLILGQRIEVEAMGITVNGYLREPRFKGIRTDA